MTSVATNFSVSDSRSAATNSGVSGYSILDRHINAQNIETYQITTSNGSILWFAFKRTCSDPKGFLNILKRIRYQSSDQSMRCQTCIMGTLKNNVPYQFKDNKTLLSGLSRDTTDLMLLNDAENLFSSNGYYHIINGPIGVQHAGGFEHLYVDLPTCTLANKWTVEDYQWFVHQHFPTMSRLMAENASSGILESLELLLSLLPKVTYGDKIQKSTEWFLKYMKMYLGATNQKDKDIIVLKALLNQYMVDGYGEEPIVATNLKQTKDTVLKAMSCAHSESALVNMLTKLFNPTTYMRRTAAPSEGSLSVAMGIFKDANFSTTVMSLSNMHKYGIKAPPSEDSSSSGGDAMSTWGAMRDGLEASRTKGQRGGAAGFAKRSGATSAASFVPPTTINELFDMIDNLPGLKVKVDYKSHAVMLTEYPDTANDLFKFEFLWAFQNNGGPMSSYGIPTRFHTITAMTPPGSMGRNVFFGIKDAYMRGSPGNTCFPTFLKEGIQRKAGSAFESLNKSTSAKIPTGGGPLALGVGTSRRDTYGNYLHTNMTFSYKDRIFTISKME